MTRCVVAVSSARLSSVTALILGRRTVGDDHREACNLLDQPIGDGVERNRVRIEVVGNCENGNSHRGVAQRRRRFELQTETKKPRHQPQPPREIRAGSPQQHDDAHPDHDPLRQKYRDQSLADASAVHKDKGQRRESRDGRDDAQPIEVAEIVQRPKQLANRHAGKRDGNQHDRENQQVPWKQLERL